MDKNRYYDPFKIVDVVNCEKVTDKTVHNIRAYLKGADKIKQVIDNTPFLIGKDQSKVNMCINNNVISRIHAKIIYKNNEYYILDMDSKNGTFVNGNKISSKEERILQSGAIIRIANTEISFYKCIDGDEYMG